jgi:acetyltransferase-like isoleucine patch superfamily enzyme
MTEKEKMLSGQLYISTDKELTAERNYAKRLCYEFNSGNPLRHIRRNRILQKLFRTDIKCCIEPPFYCDYGYNIEFGENFYANHGCVILDVNRVRIGNNVLLGPYVQICTASHPLEPDKRNTGLEYGLPIEIGSNVWIGSGAVILPDIKIGDNSIIGAGSIVTKDIPPGVLALGNPSRIIKELD